MTNINVIENKISAVKKYLAILERYKKFTQAEIEQDVDRTGMVERYLHLAVEAAIDVAEALVALKKLRKPTSVSENFYILNEADIIDSAITEELVKMVGFRNVIVHDYEKIDYSIVYDVLHHKLNDITKFLKIVEEYVGS